MNWITKKIVLSKLSQYFSNLNEEDIEISILLHHHIKLKNMSLKTEIFASEDQFLIPTECRVGYLEIQFDFSNQTPLSIKVTNANIIFKFNEGMREEKPKDEIKIIQEYHKYLKMREEYGYKSFFERKKEQLKDWFIGLLAEKTSLFIRDIQVAIEYPLYDKIHYIGLTLENINIKSRTIINEKAVNHEEKFVQLIGLGMFVGIGDEVNLIKKQGENRETWVLKRSINKLYFLKNCRVSFRLNLFNKIVEAEIQNFVMNATPTALKQIMEFSRYLVPLLNRTRPRTKPGDGEKIKMGNNYLTKGTADWWKYLSLRVMELISKRRRYNILLNPSYRKYLYCLLLNFVYQDRNPQVIDHIYCFQVNRPILQILKARQYLIQRIHSIQHPLIFQRKQNIGFIKLIGSFKKTGYLSSKEVKFQDIERSKRWNIENGKNYIKKLEIQNLFKFQVKVECKKMSIVVCENNLLYDFVKLNKMHKKDEYESDLETRNEYIRKVGGNFFKHAMNELNEGFRKDQYENEWDLKSIKSNPKAITILDINKITADIETNSKIQLIIDSVSITDLNKIVHHSEVFIANKVSVLQTLVNREMRAASLDEQNAKVSVYIQQSAFTAQKPFIEKVIFLLGLVDLDIAATSTVVQFQKTMREALYENISKTHKNGDTNEITLNIRRFNLLFPCDYSTKGNILGLQLLGISVGLYRNIEFLEVSSVKLAMTNSFCWKDEASFTIMSERKQELKESVIMNLGQIKVQNKSVMDKRGKSKQLGQNIISVTEFVIPLICIEISIKELFLLTYLITLWKSTHFTPLSSLYVRSALRRRPNHQYLSQNQQVLVNNVKQRLSFSILGIAISFISLKKEKQQCLFWIFLNDFQLAITRKAFASSIDFRLHEIYVQNISNHLPINRGILQKFTNRLLREGDRRKKGKGNNGMESLNLLLERDISMISQKQTFKMKNSVGGMEFSEDDPEEILNAFEFRSGEKNYLAKRLILMNEGEKFLKIQISDFYNHQKHHQQELIKIIIHPIHIIFEVVFIRNLKMLIDMSIDFSARKLQNFYDYMKDKGIMPLKMGKEEERLKVPSFLEDNSEEKSLIEDENVIVDVRLLKYTKVDVTIHKVVLMIFHHDIIVYCLSAFDIKAGTEERYLYSDFNSTIGEMYIVDTKPDSGKKQEIISLKGEASSFKINIRTFKNKALINRQNSKSSIHISISGVEGVFLKKKVIEFIDTLRYFIQQLEQIVEDQPRIIMEENTYTQIKKDKVEEKVGVKSEEIGVFYVVELTDSRIQVMQNSVDSSHVVGVVGKVVISNRPKEQQVPVDEGNFRDEDEFEVCQGLDNNNEQFLSFEESRKEEIETPKIYIDIEDVNIFQEFDAHEIEPLISAPRVSLEIDTQKQVKVEIEIKKLEGMLNQDQYTFIMRMLDQNFDEAANTLRPRGPYTDTLSTSVSVDIQNIYLQLNTPLESNIEIEAEGLDVKVYLYQNDKKQVKVGMHSITVNNIFKNNHILILRSFIPDSPPENDVTQMNNEKDQKKENIMNMFKQKDIIKERGEKDGMEKVEIKMSMIENRDKFDSEEYAEKDYRKETNYKKLVRCLGRFCRGCCRGRRYRRNEEGGIDEIRSNERLMSNKDLDAEIPPRHQKESMMDPSRNKEEHIEDSRYILRKKCSPDVFDKSQEPHGFLSFCMHTEPHPSFEGVKKLKVTGIKVNAEEQNALKSIISFITYPFNNPNTTIKQYHKFNRFPPNSMQIDLNNIKLVIGSDTNDYLYNSIQVLVGLRFVMEDEGDTRYGPGEQRWKLNSCVNVNYCKGNSENKYIPISLCKDAELIYNKTIKVPYYRNMDQTYQKKEEIYLTGENNRINFKFPLTQLKFIRRIIKKVNESSGQAEHEKSRKPEIIEFYSIHEELKVMIPEITLELQRGISRALVEVTLSNMYVEMEGVKSSRKEYQKKATAEGTISGNYVNMSTGNVEPFIETWTFVAKIQELFKQSQLIKLFKLASKEEEDKQRINCLNINVTTSLLKNLKDAETRYKHEGVVLDDCFYNLLEKEGYKTEVSESEQDNLVSKYRFANIDHRNFFGKKFAKFRSGKGSGWRNNKFWNLALEPYIMFYSFLDQAFGRKLVHIRTPYSICNIYGQPITLEFDVRKKSVLDKWEHTLKHGENYAIPFNIYSYDYLVTINLEKERSSKPVSVLGMLKQYQEKSQFQELTDHHPLYERAFRLLEGNPKKYISKMDTLIHSGQYILLATTIKIKYQLQKTGFYNEQQKSQDVYETQVIIIPPLIIKNELSMKMEMFIKDQIIIIQPNSQRIMVDLPTDLMDIEIYFKKVTSSKRFSIFSQKDPVSVYKIHISEGYNINMKCIKVSQFSRYLVIYSNYIIKNFTFENFEIFHKGSKILLEKSHWFFITEDEDKQVDSKFSEINFYKGTGEAQKFDPNLKKQGVVMKQTIDVNEYAPNKIRLDYSNQVLPGDEELLEDKKKRGCGGCCGKRKVSKEVDSHVKVYDFVIWVKHHANEISRTLCIYYKYQVINNSNEEFTLYHEDVEMFTMEPGQRKYLFKYLSESNRLRVGLVLNKERTFSRPFKIDAVQDFMIKIRQFPDKLYPYDKNHLFRVIISEQEDLFLIEFMSAPPKEQFLMYLENSTMHNVRIKETDQDFIMGPREKIPFFWSNLDFEKSNMIKIEIEGNAKQFIMNEVDSFQPLVLEQINNKKQIFGVTYKKGFLKLSYKEIKGEFFCVCDVLRQVFLVFDQTSNQYREILRVQLLQAVYMNTNGKNIYLYLPDGSKMTILVSSDEEHSLWREVINNSLTVRTFHKIMLRIETTDTSRILKIYELKGDETKTIKSIEYNISIGSLAIALIDSKPKQILLLGCEKLKLTSTQQFRSNCLDNLVRIKKQNILQFGKLKLNNNLQNTQNPVIQAGSKKTDNPYFQLKTVRTHYYTYNNEEISNVATLTNKQKHVKHFNAVRIFLDETEIIIDNANYAEIKKVMEEVNKMIELYSIHEVDKKTEKDIDIRKSEQFLKYAHQKELYINEFSIEPMKIVLSANWTATSHDLETTTHLAILKAMPFGISHAVVKLEGFTTYHINQNTEVLIDKLHRHYTQDIVLQILRNAGSYDLLVPLKIIGGVGVGAKNIFYDPIYTLFTKKDIKSSSSKVLEGCVSLITTFVEVLFKFINVIFKFLAFLTFDPGYNTRRNSLLRTTMKNPKFAIVHGGVWWLKLLPEVVTGFYYRPMEEFRLKGVLGIFLGILSACMGVLKPVIGIYDIVYCLWFGLVNMTDYEPEPMKFRSRPIRVFKNNLVRPYSRYQALAHQVMSRNKIQQIKNEFIEYAQEVYLKGKPVYIIITNYRLITSKETFSYNSIKFYKIKEIFRKGGDLNIVLNIADIVSCCLCLTRKKSNFVYSFDDLRKAEFVEEKLKDSIQKNHQNPLERSQELIEFPARRTTKTSHK